MLIGSPCVAVTGTGGPGTPYVPALVVDPAVTNQLACGVNGAYVPPPSIEVADTNCIDLSGTGFPGDPVTATLKIDPDNVCNLAVCNPPGGGSSGLDVRLFTDASQCANLTGCGTVGDPLVPNVAISGSGGNILTCNTDGLYVGTSGAGAINFYGEINCFIPAVIPAAFIIGGAFGRVPFDTVASDVGVVTDIANSRFVIPVGGAGYYYIMGQCVVTPANPNSFTGPDTWEVRTIIVVNGGQEAYQTQARYDAYLDTPNASMLMRLVAGDVVEIWFESSSLTGPPGAWVLGNGNGATQAVITRVGV